MQESNEVLRHALAIAHTDAAAALADLAAGIERARASNDHEGICLLAKHAAVISFTLGHIEDAIRYYQEALRIAPEDASVHLALGNAYSSTGDHDNARMHFTRSQDLATMDGDIDIATAASRALAALKK